MKTASTFLPLSTCSSCSPVPLEDCKRLEAMTSSVESWSLACGLGSWHLFFPRIVFLERRVAKPAGLSTGL